MHNEIIQQIVYQIDKAMFELGDAGYVPQEVIDKFPESSQQHLDRAWDLLQDGIRSLTEALDIYNEIIGNR